MPICVPDDRITRIVKAFGFEPGELNFFQLTIPVGDLVTIDVTYTAKLGDNWDLDALEEVSKKFCLMDVEEMGKLPDKELKTYDDSSET